MLRNKSWLFFYLPEHGLDIFVGFYRLQLVAFRMGILLCIGTSCLLAFIFLLTLEMRRRRMQNDKQQQSMETVRVVCCCFWLFSLSQKLFDVVKQFARTYAAHCLFYRFSCCCCCCCSLFSPPTKRLCFCFANWNACKSLWNSTPATVRFNLTSFSARCDDSDSILPQLFRCLSLSSNLFYFFFF